MRPLRVYGWVAVIVVVLTVLIAGVAAHRVSAPSLRSAGAGSAAPAVKSHSADAPGHVDVQSMSAGIAINPAYFSPARAWSSRPLREPVSDRVP